MKNSVSKLLLYKLYKIFPFLIKSKNKNGKKVKLSIANFISITIPQNFKGRGAATVIFITKDVQDQQHRLFECLSPTNFVVQTLTSNQHNALAEFRKVAHSVRCALLFIDISHEVKGGLVELLQDIKEKNKRISIYLCISDALCKSKEEHLIDSLIKNKIAENVICEDQITDEYYSNKVVLALQKVL